MGLGNNSTATYVDMRNGKIYRYSKTNEMGTTPIQNKNGDIKYYFIYDYIEGTVTNFSTREEEVVGKTKLILIHVRKNDLQMALITSPDLYNNVLMNTIY